MTKFLSLKEEYAIREAYKKSIEVQEVQELFESYVLIAEELDAPTIKRIVDSMNSVEEVLSPFFGTLGALKTGLDAAEAELNNLIKDPTRTSKEDTAAMLSKALSFYQGISEFLRQDLPKLLTSSDFVSAKDSPSSPVGASTISAFSKALQIRKTGGWIKRFFTSSNLPYLDNDLLATQLSNLSYNELEKLSQVGKSNAPVVPRAEMDAAVQTATTDTTSSPPPNPFTHPGASLQAPPRITPSLQMAALKNTFATPEHFMRWLNHHQMNNRNWDEVLGSLNAKINK